MHAFVAGNSYLELRAQALNQYSYLHFATHGQIDGRYPNRSFLALRQPSPKIGPLIPSGADGKLEASEIRSLPLDVELVVLNACQTSNPYFQRRGEGALTLTHSFLLAGARRVLANRYDVYDSLAAVTMPRFYELLSAMRPEDALQQLRIEMAQGQVWPVGEAAFGLPDPTHPRSWSTQALYVAGSLREMPTAPNLNAQRASYSRQRLSVCSRSADSFGV